MRLLANIALLFLLFPYVAIFPTDSGLQPNALVFNLLFILYCIVLHNFRVNISYVTLIFFIVFLYSIIVPSLLDSISLRGVVPYASLVIFSLSGYLMFRKKLFSAKIIKYAIWIWLFIGVVQILFYRKFGYFLLSMTFTSSSAVMAARRGVLSLAPEPSYYGIMCLFMIVAIDMLLANGMFSKKSATRYKILLIFQMVFLAQSFTAIFLYLIYLASGVLVTLSFKRVAKTALYSVGSLLLLMFLINKFNLGFERLYFMLDVVFSNPTKLLRDTSAVDRATDIYMSMYGFYDSLPLAFGHGTMAWAEFLRENVDMIPNDYFIGSNRIMSGYGGALFELGYIGILIPITTFISFWTNGTTRMKGIGLFLVVSMFSAIPLSFPLYSFLVGMSEAVKHRRTSGRRHPEGSLSLQSSMR